jgi:hypothetical protein
MYMSPVRQYFERPEYVGARSFFRLNTCAIDVDLRSRSARLKDGDQYRSAEDVELLLWSCKITVLPFDEEMVFGGY